MGPGTTSEHHRGGERGARDNDGICMYPPPHMHVSSSSYACILLLICMYPPPHMHVSSSSYARDNDGIWNEREIESEQGRGGE